MGPYQMMRLNICGWMAAGSGFFDMTPFWIGENRALHLFCGCLAVVNTARHFFLHYVNN